MSKEKGIDAMMSHGKQVLESELENEDMTNIAITIPCVIYGKSVFKFWKK